MAFATLTATSAVACPDWQAEPHFGQIDLYAGFQPDPYRIRVTAGGDRSLDRCGFSGATGYTTSRPDFDLYWNGSSAELTIAVDTEGWSNADAILIINDPSGEWHYSDDYIGTDPAITFYNPQEGLYDIWIGSYDGSRRNPAELVFTELPW